MPDLDLALAFFLLLNIAAGLLRIVRGPTRVDRMLAAQLFGTTGVAVLLLWPKHRTAGATGCRPALSCSRCSRRWRS